jgi:CheY-like chemotaxis protein
MQKEDNAIKFTCSSLVSVGIVRKTEKKEGHKEEVEKVVVVSVEDTGINDPLLALSRYKAGAYDLLLLDINMPRMNGFKLYQEILSRHSDNHVKVCFITAFEEYNNQFKELFPGLEEVDCFIRKPIALKALTEKVKSRLQ